MVHRSSRVAAPLAVTFLAAAVLAAGPAPAAPPDDGLIVHVLNRVGFGPRPGDVARLRTLGVDAYIEQQLHPERIPDGGLAARLERLQTIRLSTRELVSAYFAPADVARRLRQQRESSGAGEMTPAAPPPMAPIERGGPRTVLLDLQQQKLLRAIYSERQLEEVLVDLWFNHFNVFAQKGQTRAYVTEYERDTIRPRVLGSFRELLGAVAASPAMLFYLDNWQSVAPRREGARRAMMPEARRGRGINENYARELLELHTLGVDGGYTQKDVQEIARAFTGWTIDRPRQGGGFVFNARLHDSGEKVVLGHRLPAGGGQRDGERVLDLLAGHPATARFIAAKLARRFVSDAPPRPLVDRLAATFTATKGNLRAVMRVLLASPEFRGPAVRGAKTKTPFEFVASAARALDVRVVSAVPLAQATRQLGMPLYLCQPPTGYADTADAWINTGALLNRMSFAVALAGGEMRGVRTPAQFGGEALRLGSPDFQKR